MRFSRKRRFFAAFRSTGVSMVTENGIVVLDIHNWGTQSSEAEVETRNCGVSTECRGLRTED